jgi:hypothetical protein
MTIQVITVGFVLWFGFYLQSRDYSNKRLRYTGLGLLFYAIALSLDLFANVTTSDIQSEIFLRTHWGFLLLPSLFWAGATLELGTGNNAAHSQLRKIWLWGFVPVCFIASGLFPVTYLLWDAGKISPNFIGLLVIGITSALPLIAGILIIPGEVRRLRKQNIGERRANGLVLVASLFFGLGSGIVLLRVNWLPHHWAILAIGLDLELLGFAIAYLDTFGQGETFLPDMLHSLVASSFAAILFGGQVAFAIALSTGVTLPMVGLLIATIMVAILTQIFSDPIQGAFDRLVFSRLPRLRQERAELRATANALSRSTTKGELNHLNEDQFTRLTRRALSQFSDLPKLASNPLTHLPIIQKRLHAQGAHTNTLERAAELKTLLSESIEQLKPSKDVDFGTSDEWRFYNAVYYPYVIGLRPYSRRSQYISLDQETKAILNWFRTNVPERTLYNWQNAAAALIANDLREKNYP